MKRTISGLVLAAVLLALGACGPVHKSVFTPLASIQQLHLTSDGHWQMQLRIQNNSYTGVKFTRVDLDMQVNGTNAGHISTVLDLDIPELSVDIADVTLAPGPAARQALINAQGSTRYTLKGTITGIAEDETTPRTFKVQGKDWLSPVPGVPHTWR